MQNGGKYCWLQSCQGKDDKVIVIETVGILPFYLIQMTSSAALSFQLIVNSKL